VWLEWALGFNWAFVDGCNEVKAHLSSLVLMTYGLKICGIIFYSLKSVQSNVKRNF